MAYCSSTDLEFAVGGAANLVQLLDKDRDGVADTAYVTACIAKADSEIDSALQVRHELPLAAPYPAILVTHGAALAAYYAHQNGTDGQGVPERIAAAAKDARDWLDMLAAGTRTVGTTTAPTANQQVDQIDTNPDGGWVTRESLRGFW